MRSSRRATAARLLMPLALVPGLLAAPAAHAAPTTISTGPAVSPVAAAAPSIPGVGVKYNPMEQDPGRARAHLAQARAAGVRHVTVPAAWWHLCPTSSRCSYAPIVQAVDAVRESGMSVTVQVLGAPDWLHPDLAGRPQDVRRWTLPRDDAERASFERFTAGLAASLRGKVTRYEIWNEPDLPEFNGAGASPEDFARTVAAGYRGVKAQDPSAIVVSGGLSRSAVTYVERMLAALDREPGAAANNGYVDEIGIHPYADDASPNASDPAKAFVTRTGFVDFNFTGYRRVISLLDARGRKGTKVWLGEVGYSTTQTWMRPVPDWRRAAYVMMAAEQVARDPRVSGLVWFGLTPGSGIGPEWSLLDHEGRGTQTFDALRRVNQGGSVVPVADQPECAVGRLTRAEGATRFSASCFPAVSSKTRRHEVYVDGKPVVQADGPAVTVPAWAIAQAGDREISAVFYDDSGVLGVTSVGQWRRVQ